jgi:tetratricopeptide (TPR) repeat protein
LCVCLWLCAASRALEPVQATDAPTLLRRAEAQYRASDWTGAEAAWREALEQPLSDAVRAHVCRNLGNAAYRLQQPTQAVAWYEAARRLAPRDADTWTNLEFVRRRLEWPPADRGDLRSSVERVLGAVTPREAEWLAVLGLVPLALLCLLEALRGGRLAQFGIVCALLFAFACAAPLLRHAWATRPGECLVVERDGAALRAEPNDAVAAIGRAPGGARVWRIDEWPGWTRVEDEHGLRGWLPTAQVFSLQR